MFSLNGKKSLDRVYTWRLADSWHYLVADRGGGGGNRRPPPTNSVRSLPTPSAPVDLTADVPVFHDGVLKANISWTFEHGIYLHYYVGRVCFGLASVCPVFF